MHEFRVTKFNPALRAADGTYQGSTWTSVADIGKRFSGSDLTAEAYLATEHLYIRAIEEALRLAGLDRLRVTDLDSYGAAQPPNLPPLGLGFLDARTEDLSPMESTTVAQAVLRELAWAKLAGDNGFYVHFGWDYYMYIGGTAPQLANLSSPGMFVEPFKSPYSAVGE